MSQCRSFAAWLAAAFLLGVAAVPLAVHAHGLHGHVHVTGWAIENLPEGELRTMFQDPDVFHAALSGAMFPDTGYALDRPGARDYGESAHWEPFIDPFVRLVRDKYGPTYETKEEKMLAAFLLGCASHGLQDELFDSTFLFEVEQHDGPGQEITDPAIDGFLVLDGYFRLLPRDYFPIDELLPLYAPINPVIDHELIAGLVQIVRDAYVNDSLGVRIAAGNGTRYRSRIPWGAEHWIDMSVPGSLGAEVEATRRHIEAVWERLNGRFDDANLVVHAWPDPPRRLRSANHQDVASWVTFVFGKGVQEGSATTSLVDSSGAPHPYNLRYTRYGGTSRIIRFQPTADFTPGETYTAAIHPGATLVDGSVAAVEYEHSFQVECDSPEDPRCPPISPEDPTIVLPPPSPTPTATSTRTVTPTRTPSTAPPRCPGDCSGDLAVNVDELLRCVATITDGISGCPECDADAGGQVTVDDLLAAVSAALAGCD
jgi:hypothetical protein